MSMPALLGAALLAGLLAGFTGGWKVQAWRAGAEATQRAEVAAEAERQTQRLMDAAAVRHEAEKARIAAQRVVITREVERVITVETAAAAAVCLGPDGLRLVAEAVTGAASAPRKPAATLPTIDTAR